MQSARKKSDLTCAKESGKGSMKRQKKVKKFNKIKIGIVIFLIVLAISCAVFGRYVYNGVREAYFTSKAFYFTSDLLTLDNATYQYDNWGGVDAYELNFDLYSYANTLLRLDYDLNYSVSCETPDTDKVTLRY